jgi:hypothetical protein
MTAMVSVGISSLAAIGFVIGLAVTLPLSITYLLIAALPGSGALRPPGPGGSSCQCERLILRPLASQIDRRPVVAALPASGCNGLNWGG